MQLLIAYGLINFVGSGLTDSPNLCQLRPDYRSKSAPSEKVDISFDQIGDVC